MLDDLLSIALIGTGRGEPAESALPPALREAASGIPDSLPQHRLLTQTMLADAYLRAGHLPGRGGPPPNIAEVDSLPACSVRAADLLSELMRDNARALIGEWLAAAASGGRRVPHRLLPDLLELSRRDQSVSEAVAAVIDQRGRWMISHNPEWAPALAVDVAEEGVWETGTIQERLAWLRRARQVDPAHAGEMLRRTWKSDGAEERVEFLKAFTIGLSSADEPLLEGMLDDRSKQVRAVAADLLGRLPNSQLVQRMIARVAPLLQFKRGLLRGMKIDVTLPADLDKASQRDGIEKVALQGVGEKQWWLQQMVSFVPLATWTEKSGQKPAEIVSGIAKTEFADALLKGLDGAAERGADPVWIDALLRHGLERHGRLNRVLLAALPARSFLDLANALLSEKRVGLLACSDLVNNHNVPLDSPAARLWVGAVAELASGADRAELTVLYHLPEQAAMRVPPSASADIEALWTADKEPWVHYRKGVEKLLKTLEIRRQIHKEFGP